MSTIIVLSESPIGILCTAEITVSHGTKVNIIRKTQTVNAIRCIISQTQM